MDTLRNYCCTWSTSQDPVLAYAERQTHLRTIAPQMIAGPYQGLFLTFFSTALQPERILEVGAFTGYASICLARGLGPGGKLTAIEINPEYADLFSDHITRAGLEDATELIVGDARTIIPEMAASFDLIYLDANKRDYPAYYPLLIDKLTPNGFLLIDNVLWGGKVVSENHDPDTRKMQQFNEMVAADVRVTQCILPVRDGLMLVKKNHT